MALLALDISTRCGWAGVDYSGHIRHGTFVLPKERRFVAFYDFVREKIHEIRPSVLAYEAQFFAGHGTHLLIQLAGVARLAAQMHDIGCFDGFTAAHIKKEFTGDGKADKAKMIAACNIIGLLPQDDNAADAIALLAVCMNNKSKMTEL